jgi:uncharacterized protein (DUF433 family)
MTLLNFVIGLGPKERSKAPERSRKEQPVECIFVKHVEKTPGVCGGRACIAGHRIRVQDIVVLHEMRRMSPKEIVVEYPTITLADVHAALAYYYDNQQEIADELRKAEDWAELVSTKIPSKIPAELR